MSWRTLEAIEYGQSSTDRASLRWYLEYAHFLGVSLDSLIITMLQREEGDPQIRSLRVKRYFLEDDVLEQVKEVMERLHTPENPLTVKALSTATGISSRSLRKHPRVKEFLKGILHEDREAKKRAQVSEEELLTKVQQAVKALAERREPINYTSVSRYIGTHPSVFIHYPLVKRFIQQHVDYTSKQFKPAKMNEQTLLEKVRSAIINLKALQQPVTYFSISNSIGICSNCWTLYPQVREYVDQNLDSRYLYHSKRQEEREEAIFPRVEDAISQLESLNKPVTFRALGKLLGVQHTTLKTYPRVSELVEQKGDTSLQRRQAGRTEEEVLVKVEFTIHELRNQGKSITFTSVAREMGMDSTTLKTYPRIRELLYEHLQLNHLYQQQRFSIREESLLRQVEEAIAELEALHVPVTQRAICAKIGRSTSNLRLYPRIKAVFDQKASMYHDYQRRCSQPEEGELLLKVEEAVSFLTSQGMPVTRDAVAHRVRISPDALMQYPLVVDFLVQHGYKKLKPGSERAVELYSLAQEAIQVCKLSGLPITKRELSRIVGVSGTTLYYYPTVRALMTQAVKEDKQQRQKIRFQQREDDLTLQVTNAIQQLRDKGKKISVRAVGNCVHVSPVCLLYYPKVSSLLQSAMMTQ